MHHDWDTENYEQDKLEGVAILCGVIFFPIRVFSTFFLDKSLNIIKKALWWIK